MKLLSASEERNKKDENLGNEKRKSFNLT